MNDFATEPAQAVSTRRITLNEAVDEAIERLPLFRRRVAKRRLRNPRHRQALMEELQVALHDDEECCRMIGMQSAFASTEFNAATEFGIDLDNFERFLQIIIQYLPKLLEIILPLFLSLLLPFAVVVLLPTSAMAQQVCKGPQCGIANQGQSVAQVSQAPNRSAIVSASPDAFRVGNMPSPYAESFQSANAVASRPHYVSTSNFAPAPAATVWSGPTYGATVYAVDSSTVCLASGGSNLSGYAVRPSVGVARYRGGMAAPLFRSGRAGVALLGAVGKGTRNFVSAFWETRRAARAARQATRASFRRR